MARIAIRSEVIEKIKSDIVLRTKIALALGVKIESLTRLIYGNDSKLTQVDVLKIIREHLDLQDADILGEMQIV